MQNLEFGLTMLIVGMGGTLLTLWLLALILRGLTKFFPAPDASSPGASKNDRD